MSPTLKGHANPTADSTSETILSHHVAQCMADYFKALDGHPPVDLHQLFLEQVEAPFFRAVMQYSNGNQTNAAEILGLNRATLRKKLKQYGIAP